MLQLARLVITLKIKALKILCPKLYPGKHFRFISGGRGSGKSWGIIIYIITWCTQYPVFIVCGREIQESIEDSIYKLIVDTIRRMGLLDDFHILSDEVRHKSTGARIVFYGLRHNPEAIKGLESAHVLYIDEADKVSRSTWDIVIPTMRVKGWTIIASWNPQSPSDPIEAIWRENAWRGVREHCTYLDNPDLDQSKVDEAEEMKRTDYERYCHIYLGHYRPDGDNCVIPLKHIISAQARPVLRTRAPIIAGFDPALTGNDTAGFVVRQGDSVLKIHEWSKKEAHELRELAYLMCVTESVDYLVIDADGMGAPIYQEMRNAYPALTIVPHYGNGSKPDPAYTNARAYCWFMMRDAIVKGLAIPQHRQLSEELQRQTFKLDNDGRYQLPRKDDMKKQGIPSPNLGDALAMTWSPALQQAIKLKTAPPLVLRKDADHIEW